LHDLRHTFAGHFIMSTGDLPALQKILGHATLAMTMRYAHLARAASGGPWTRSASAQAQHMVLKSPTSEPYVWTPP
jgi:integrase